MASQGPNSPSAATTVADGDINWAGSPSNLFASDDVDVFTIVQAPSDEESDLLVATGFGFSIPSGASIDGYLVELEGQRSVNRGFVEAQLHFDGSVVGVEKLFPALPSDGNDDIVAAGADDDTWDAALDAEDVNDSAFGIALRASNTSTSSSTISLDHVRITVFYTAAPAGHGMLLSQYRNRLVIPG